MYCFISLILFCSIFSTMALPVITPSAPAFAALFTWLGFDIPNPIAIGWLVCFFSFLMNCIAVSGSSFRAPVTPSLDTA